MKKIFAATLLVLAVQGCSSNSPSASDAEKALKADLPDCKNLSIENVKLTNGMKIDDLTHQVQVHFDIRVIPLPEKTVEEADQANERFKAEQQASLDQSKDIDNQIESLEKQRSNAQQQEQVELAHEWAEFQQAQQEAQFRHEGLDPREVDKKGEAMQASLDEKFGVRQLNDQIQSLQAKKRDLYSAATAKAINLDDAWGSKACRAKSGVAGAGIGGGMGDALRNGLVTSYDATFTMQKSDNGWVEVK